MDVKSPRRFRRRYLIVSSNGTPPWPRRDKTQPSNPGNLKSRVLFRCHPSAATRWPSHANDLTASHLLFQQCPKSCGDISAEGIRNLAVPPWACVHLGSSKDISLLFYPASLRPLYEKLPFEHTMGDVPPSNGLLDFRDVGVSVSSAGGLQPGKLFRALNIGMTGARLRVSGGE